MPRLIASAVMAVLLIALSAPAGGLVPVAAQTPEAEVVAIAGTTIVDDLSDGFRRIGSGWRSAPGGFDGHHYWSPASRKLKRVGIWTATLGEPGLYRVVAKLPVVHSSSRTAIYRLKTADGWATRVRSQAAYRGRWVDLGTHAFTTQAEVRLTDRTRDPRGMRRMVAFDALEFIPVEPPEPPVIIRLDVEARHDRAIVTFSLAGAGPARSEYREAGSSSWSVGGNETSSKYADHRQVISGLTPETGYELRVIATNLGGQTVSPIVGFRMLAPPPPVIHDLRVAPQDTRAAVTFSLDAKGPARTEYRRAGSSEWLPGAEETSSSYRDHEQMVRGLAPQTDYELRIVAANAGGRTVSDITLFSTLQRTVDCDTGEKLQAAIDRARPNDTIIVTGRCVGTFTVLKDLTLEGSGGAVIDGGQGRWALLAGSSDGTSEGWVGGVDLEVRNLTIAGGRESALDSWGNVLLRDVVVRGSAGSGIYAEGAVTVQRSTVRGNAGSGYSSGTVSRLVVIDSVFRDNGAAGISMGNGDITISGSTVDGNGGVGIRCVAQSSLQMSDTTVTRNAGGGLHISYCPGRITDSMIVGNRTSGDGGGIWTAGWISEGYAPRIERCTIRDNQAAGRGGGIFNAKPRPEHLGPLVVVDTTIRGNTAGAGGGIYSEEEMALTNVTFSANTPDACLGLGCP